MKNNQLPVRHGDLSFHPLDKIPAKAKSLGGSTSYIAGLGETTGHKHIVKSDVDFDVFEVSSHDGRGNLIKELVYKLDQPAIIEHEEHRTITLPAGIYQQKQEIEEDPFTEETHYVLD